MPYAALADHVFRTYHWTEDEWLTSSAWLWDELQQVWAARAFVNRLTSKAPEAEDTKGLINLAKQQGFDVDPTWETEGND